MDIIKVSGTSRTAAVAGAIAGVVREHKRAEIQVIGARAVNQAVKALILATGYLKGDGIEVVMVPEFMEIEIEGKSARGSNSLSIHARLFYLSAGQYRKIGRGRARIPKVRGLETRKRAFCLRQCRRHRWTRRDREGGVDFSQKGNDCRSKVL